MSDTKHDHVVKVPAAEGTGGLDRFFKIGIGSFLMIIGS